MKAKFEGALVEVLDILTLDGEGLMAIVKKENDYVKTVPLSSLSGLIGKLQSEIDNDLWITECREMRMGL